MGYNVSVPVDTNMPGVVTEVHQRIDLSSLAVGEFNRIVNACKVGVVTGRGYVRSITKQLAEINDLTPPIAVTLNNEWSGSNLLTPLVNEERLAPMWEEIMRLGDVRWKLKCSTRTDGFASHYANYRSEIHNSRSSWWGPHMSLRGLNSTTEIRALLKNQGILSDPKFRQDLDKLLEVVRSKPAITIVSKEL